MSRVALVSGSDANYYPLLREWIASVRRFPQSMDHDLCVIDAGLSPDQVAALAPLVTAIVRPPWPSGIPEHKTKGLDYLLACVCRPFLPDLFPGYQTYLWMDSDAWVQNWSAVDMFLQCAAQWPGRMILTNGTDRAYPRQFRVKWFGPWPYSVRTFYSVNARAAFGNKVAKALLPYCVLSAGCFAASGQAPHWARWQALVVQAARRGRLFTAEQVSLGRLIYYDGFPAEVLPAYTHWLMGTRPAWDPERQMFVEPFYPHAPLGVIHMTGVDAMRADRRITEPFPTPRGDSVALNCRYPHHDAGPLSVAVPDRV